MHHSQRNVLLAIVVLMASSLGLWAQGNLGGLTGHITDPSGALIPDATVKVDNMETTLFTLPSRPRKAITWYPLCHQEVTA